MFLLQCLAPAHTLAEEAVAGERVRAIAEKLQCPVCQGTSAADSPSQVAVDMRAVIRSKLEAGEAERDILRYFQDRYGPGILREPPRSGVYSVVWWVPGLALVLGAVVILGIVRSRRAAGPRADEAPAPATPGDAPPAEADMEEYRRRVHDLERGGQR